MRRWLALIALVMTMLMGSLSTISAQEATPTTGKTTSAVTIYGNDGQPAGEIVVDSIVDPFKDYDSSSAPQRGFHYVMASVKVTATETAIDVSTYGFSIVDKDGFLYTPTAPYRTEESTTALPDFQGGTLEAGQSMSGVIFFEVLDGTTPAFVVYQPTYEQLITAADMRDETVAQGDAVEFLSSDGQPAATLTVDGVVSPLKDYDTSYAPQRGFEFVGVQVTIENTGSQVFSVDPYDFVFVDAQGFVSSSYGVVRTTEAEAQTPSLQSADLAAGQKASGLVTFQVLAGTEPGLIYYGPSSDRQVRLAEYGEGQAPQPSGTPAAVPTRPSLGTEVTPAADKTPVSSADCDGVVEWAQASLTNITTWSDAFTAVGEVFSGGNVDPQSARDAADKVTQAAKDQADLDVPDIAKDANDALIDAFNQSADALNELADAAEANDTAGMLAAAQKITAIGTSASDGDLNNLFDELSKACPELENIGS